MKTSNPMLEKLLPILPLIAANAAQAEKANEKYLMRISVC
ncbi:Uncharacterised protein [Serratia fonticola]|uniref:Uncharacterized protein n=1 Tax=Serratia fonticola TaxID=47917 RepID=A0A4U9TQ08_SERFO|nr:Uncharacterised protein [Serratia fonticola]